MKFSLQITNPLPAIAALLTIIGLLAGTTTTAIIPAVWATTGTVPIDNRTDTEVTTQGDEGLADEETPQSTATVGGEPSSTNQSESTTEEEDENTSAPSTEAPDMESSDTSNQTETEGQEPSSSSSSANQSDSTTLASSNSTNATATANATNAINNTDARLDGRIVFAKAPTGDDPFSTDIYVMDADGSGGQTRLTRTTDTGASASSPSWSPDGGKIAFESDRDGNREIYVMNADGSSVTRLTNNNASDESPSWSPDGERIAFVSDRAFQDAEGLNRNHEIYVMNSGDGSGQTRLTNNNALDYNPSWSPDSERIAFNSNRDGNSEIYVMEAGDGSGQTRLTEESEDDYNPSWSPDGEKIALESNRGGQRGIFVMNADDGSNVTRLTDGGNPAWSPAGEKITFVSSRDAGDESDDNAIYVMNSTGDDGSSNVTRLTEPDSYYTDLDWGRNTSTPGGGNGGGGGGSTPTTPRPQQIIDEAISTIENLDNIPQSLRTNIIALLRQVLDSLNDDNSTTPTNTTTTTELASSSSLRTQGLSTHATTVTPYGCWLPLPQINVQ